MSKRTRTTFAGASTGPIVQAPVRRAVKKTAVIVGDNVVTNITVGVGTNVASTTLYRCGEVVSGTGAPQSQFVNDSCTMVRFIFNGGYMCSGAVDVTNSIGTLFVVAARVKKNTSITERFRGTDNELLTTSFADMESIFYSGAFPYQAPQTTSQARTIVPLAIDMKAKRKMATGDTIVLFCWTVSLLGTASVDCFFTGVGTVIAI